MYESSQRGTASANPPALRSSPLRAAQYAQLEARHQRTFEAKQREVHALVDAMRARDANATAQATARVRALQAEDGATRAAAVSLIQKSDKAADSSDTNYIFLTFVVNTLP